MTSRPSTEKMQLLAEAVPELLKYMEALEQHAQRADAKVQSLHDEAIESGKEKTRLATQLGELKREMDDASRTHHEIIARLTEERDNALATVEWHKKNDAKWNDARRSVEARQKELGTYRETLARTEGQVTSLKKLLAYPGNSKFAQEELDQIHYRLDKWGANREDIAGNRMPVLARLSQCPGLGASVQLMDRILDLESTAEAVEEYARQARDAADRVEDRVGATDSQPAETPRNGGHNGCELVSPHPHPTTVPDPRTDPRAEVP